MQNNFTTAKFLLIGALIMAIYYSFGLLSQPKVNESEAKQPEAASSGSLSATAQAIKPITTDELKTLVTSADKPTLLFIYASWCPYCQQQMPIINELTKEMADKVQIVGLSTDDDDETLAKFIAKKPDPLPFTPYRMKTESGRDFQVWLQQNGAIFRGIPYSVLLAKDGQVLGIFAGLTQKSEFVASINKNKQAAN